MRFFRRSRAATGAPASNTDGAATHAMLRRHIILTDPSTVGIRPSSDLATVWGLIMDWGLDAGVATIVSLADGTTSMYTSSGSGVIGAGAHQAAATASINAARLAESRLLDFPLVQDSPLPGPGRTALTILTYTGLRRVEEANSVFADGSSATSPVWSAMQQVIYEIGRIESQQKSSG